MTEDRLRKDKRQDTQQPVQFRTKRGLASLVWMLNLSRSGCQVQLQFGRLVPREAVTVRPVGFESITEWVDARIFRISFGSMGLVLAGTVVPVRLDALQVPAGILLFITAMLIHGQVFATRDMKTIQELGFTRNRDLLLYSGSAVGMDVRLSLLGLCAFLLAISVGSGAIGRGSGGAAFLLAFSVFALAGAVARLRRKWPVDASPSE